MKRKKLNGWGYPILMAVVLLVTAIPYLRTLTHELVWDDPRFIKEWETPKHTVLWGGFLTGDSPWEHGGVYRPLRSLFYGLSWQLYHGSPVSYHTQALLVYLFTTLMVILITNTLTGRREIGLIAGLIYGLHPVHAEGVSWVTASFDTMGIGLMLLAYWLYLRYRSGNKKYYWWSVGLATAAYFANEITLVLPLLMMITDYWLPPKARVKIRDYVWYLIPLLVYMFVRTGLLQIVGRNPYPFGSLLPTLGFMLGVIPRYWGLLVWPVNLTVNHQLASGVNAFFFADHNLAQPLTRWEWWQPVGLLTITLCAVMVGLALKKKRQWPLGQWVFWWVIIALLPVMQIFPLSSLMTERYLMVSSVGFCVGLAWLIWTLSKRYGRLVIVAIGVLVLSYGYQTWQRNGDWQNNLTLWQQALAMNPTSSSSYTNLGEAYYQRGELAKARQVYEKAAELNPSVGINWTNLGIIDYQMGKKAEAKRNYEQALKVEPNYTQAMLYLGVWEYEAGDWAKAGWWYREALKIRPDFAQAWNYLAMTEHQLGNLAQAEQDYRLAIGYQADYADAYNNLGNLYRDMGRVAEAKASYEKGLNIDPGHAFARKNLSELGGEVGD